MKSPKGKRSHDRVSFSLILTAVVLALSQTAGAQEPLLPVDFNDPAIAAWRSGQRPAIAQAINIPEINLPVLNFIPRNQPAAPVAAAPPTVSVPEGDRESYAITNDMGSLEITIFG